MNKDLLKVSIRQNAIYLPLIEEEKKQEELTSTTIALVAQLRKVGYSLSEELLHAINQLYPAQQMMILQVMKEALGVTLNWSPLVKGWDVPTGETRLDHLVTWIANLFNSQKGVKLPCGHVIPDNTFPMERYNGCPFCGTPFQTATTEYFGQGSKLKVLELWQDKELNAFFYDLQESGFLIPQITQYIIRSREIDLRFLRSILFHQCIYHQHQCLLHFDSDCR